MESKQNDLMLNILENPSFSISDFQNVGLTADNTSLELESTYASSPIILNNPLFLNSNGDFDSVKFHKVYQGAQQAYNYLATSKPEPFKATFSKYNVFAPMELRDWNPQFKIKDNLPNPDLITRGLIRIGEDGPRDKSREEIAQTQLVKDKSTGKFLPAPNDDFWGTVFGDTRILAQYDKDVDVNGKERGQIGFDENNIEHFAGDYKLNENGTYYYETANGRNIYGKQVLHMSDIITRDDSKLNAIDFFDSDGLDKSPVGSLVKNAALVGAMFLPYVGPYIAGATILQQSLALGATLGKIALRSPDNKQMNYLIGLSEASNFMNTRSEYSREHTWSIENLLGMVGDVVGQLRQQRLLFKYLPVVAKGKWGTSEANQLKLQEKYLNELNAASKRTLSSTKGDPLEMAAKMQKIQAFNSSEAATKLEKYMSEYYNVGGTLSKAYMTMLTVNDIYGEALEAGASGTDAAIITAGYAAAEYALLSTDVGKWILPELRASRQKARGVSKALTKEALENFSKLKATATTPEAKRTYIQKVLDFAKKIAHADFAVGKKGTEVVTKGFGVSKAGVGAVVSGALAEATEETSEELLADFSRQIFNVIQDLRGTDARMKPFENWQDRYAMSFLGGFIGGGVSASTIDYKQAKSYANMSYNQAIQELIYMDRNDETQEIYKLLDNETIGNKYLSAKNVVKDENGNIIGWQQGDANDNLDLDIKNRVRSQLRLIHDTLTASGGYASDDELLANNLDILKDLRYNALKNTASAGKFIQEFNRLDSLYIEKMLEYNSLNSADAKREAGEGDQKGEESPALEQRRSDLLKEMEEIKTQIEDMRVGKKAPLFMANALIESTPFISKALMNSTYRYYVESKEGKKWDELSESDKVKYIDEWNNYQKTDMKDDVALATHGYLSATTLYGNKLKEIEESMKKLLTDENLQEYLNSVDSFFEAVLQDSNLLRNNIQDEKLNEDEWLSNVQTAENSEILDGKSFSAKIKLMTDAFEEDLARVQKARTDAMEANAAGMIDEETLQNTLEVNNYKSVIENYINSINEYVEKTVYNPLMEKIEGFIKIGNVNGAIKEKLAQSLSQVIELYKSLSGQLSGELETLEENPELLDEFPEVAMGLKSFSEIFKNPFLDTYKKLTYSSEDGSVKSLSDLLQGLSYTPIMDILDSFILNITSRNNGLMKISELLQKLSSLYTQNKEDISRFNIEDDDILVSLREGLQVIELLEGVVEGSRNDNIRLDTQLSAAMKGQDKKNLWGINAILNEVHRKAPKIENDTWEDLPEISGNLADMILQDIRLVKNQLGFYSDLYAINSGQKLNQQVRLSVNINYLLYKSLKKFVTDVVPEDWDKRGLEKALAEAKTLESLMDEKPLNVSNDTYTRMEKERILLETAVYNFFNVDNSDKLTDVKKLSELFAADKFNLFTQKSNLLTEKATTIDDHAFIAWLSMKAALNSNDYHRNFKELLVDTERAPLASLEIGAYLQLANVLNGNVITNFQKAVKRSMIEYFDGLNYDLREKLLKDAGYGSFSGILALDSGKKYLTNMDFIPTYSNITFVEGIAGAGKSEGVNRFVVRYLQKYNPDILANSWVAHISEEDANKYGHNINLAEGSYKVFDRKSLMEFISDDWKNFEKDSEGNYTINSEDFIFNDLGQVVPTWKIKNLKADKLPKVIIIDEISRYTHLDLLLLDKFAKKYGISVIVTGDLDQSLAKGKLEWTAEEINEINEELKSRKKPTISASTYKFIFKLNRNTLMRCPKLGTSLRTANSQKTKNLVVGQAVVQNLEGPLQLAYYEDDRILNGDKVYLLNSKETADGTTYVLSDLAKNKILLDVKQRMIPNLKENEKIGFIYYSENSDLYKLLMSDSSIANYIEKHKGNSAQGKEGKYWIVEVNPNKDTESYFLDLYTGITRAQDASLLITPNKIGDIEISSYKEENTQLESLKQDSIKKFSKRIKTIYDTVTEEGSDIEYIERTKENVVENAPSEETEEPEEEPEEEETEEPEEEPEEDNTEIENAAKSSSEFKLPDGYTAVKSGNNIIFSKPVPVSKQWVIKYFEDSTTSSGVALTSKDVWYALGASVRPDGKIEVAIGLKGDTSTNIGTIISKSTLIGEVFNNKVDLTEGTIPDDEVEDKKKLLKSEISTGKLIKPNDITYDVQVKNGKTVIHFLRKGTNVDMLIDPRFLLRDLDVDSLSDAEVVNYLNFIQSPVGVFSITYDAAGVVYELADGKTIKGTTTSDLPKATVERVTPGESKNPGEEAVTDTEDLLQEVAITEDSSGTPEEISEYLVHENKKTNYGHGDEPQPEDSSSGKHSGDINLKHLLYSNNTFEFGAVVHPIKRTYDKPLHGSDRIDSINGILKVKGIQSKRGGEPKGWIFRKSAKTGRPNFNIDSLDDMIEVLGRLRSKSLNTREKLDLEKYFQEALGLSNIYCRFAIKNSSPDDNVRKGSKFLRFFKSLKEKLLFNRGGSKRSLDIGFRNIVIIVGSMETVDGKIVGDVLELPLLSLNNPITVLKANKDMNQTYAAMYAAYEKAYNETLTTLAGKGFSDEEIIGAALVEGLKAARYLGRDMSYWRRTKGIAPARGCRNLWNLITLYLNTDRTIFFQDDPNWTIAKNLISYGPQLNINRGLFDPDYNPDLIQKDKMISLSEFGKDKTLHVSKIMVYTRKDGKYEYDDNKLVSGFISQPGHPFVLYSDDPELDTDDKLIAEFTRQLIIRKGEHKHCKPRVKLAYVIGPRFFFEEYIDSLIKFTTGQDSGTLGNLKTPLDMLTALMYDKNKRENPELKQLFVKIWGESGEGFYKEVKDVVDSLNELSLEDKITQLKDIKANGLLGFNNKTLSSQLQNVIKQLVLNSSFNVTTGETDYVGEFSPEHMLVLVELFKRSLKVFYDTARLTSKTDNNLFAFVKTQKGRDGLYKIDNNGRSKDINFYLHGNLSSSMYAGTKSFNDWLDSIVNNQYDGPISPSKSYLKKRLGRTPKKEDFKRPKKIADRKQLYNAKKGQYISPDNRKYTNGESWFDEGVAPVKSTKAKKTTTTETDETPVENKYSAKIQEYLRDLPQDVVDYIYKQYPPRDESDDNALVLNEIMNYINANVEGKACVSTKVGPRVILLNIYDDELGKETKISEKTVGIDGIISFKLTTNGNIYSVSLDPEKHEAALELININEAEGEIASVPLIVTKENFTLWRSLITAAVNNVHTVPQIITNLYNSLTKKGKIDDGNIKSINENYLKPEPLKKLLTKAKLNIEEANVRLKKLHDSIMNNELKNNMCSIRLAKVVEQGQNL